jgi:hypothetical protein
MNELGGCLTALMKGTVYVFSIVIGAVIIVVLGIAVLGGIYQYLMFLLQFDALGVLLGLLAPFILLFSGLYYLSWWASRNDQEKSS